MRPFVADLHVHSVLSPCADDLMLPTLVIAVARKLGLAIVGLTDHNSAENAQAFVDAARGSGVQVLPGMEVTTREEVHVLALYESTDQALSWQAFVYAHLPPLANDERAFGTQLVVDANDQLVRLNEQLLMTASDLSLAQVIAGVARFGGLAIPAHVDRPAFGLLGQLGFVPAGLAIPAFEVSRHCDVAQAALLQRSLAGRALVQSSDAHFLADIGGGSTVFWLEEPTLAEMRMALAGEGGRGIAPRRTSS